MSLPSIDELLANARVIALPMRTRFRGLTVRETMIIEGPAGAGEFAAFTEYDDDESAPWLYAGIEQAWGLGPTEAERPLFRETVPLNATLPAVAAPDVPGLLEQSLWVVLEDDEDPGEVGSDLVEGHRAAEEDEGTWRQWLTQAPSCGSMPRRGFPVARCCSASGPS